MRAGAVLIVVVACAAGCGSGRPAATASKTTTHPAAAATTGTELRVGVVGPLDVRVPGAIVVHGKLDTMPDYRLVVVSADADDAAAVAVVADAHPETHYALVGSPTRGDRRSNLAGIVLREGEAAYLGGVVAGLVAVEEGGTAKRVAWVGPEESALAAAFGRGAHSVNPAIGILHAWSRARPAACKEAALGSLARGAVVVLAHGGRCADAAIAGAHQQNHVGLRLADFELPDVAATQIVREAVGGVYHGGEDIVFGAADGAIGVNRLDPRISAATAITARTAAQDLASGRRPSR
jgi:basic membrane lipoprotein Med (substrate-binding protein (PBP1-ABC) superfamily)